MSLGIVRKRERFTNTSVGKREQLVCCSGSLRQGCGEHMLGSGAVCMFHGGSAAPGKQPRGGTLAL